MKKDHRDTIDLCGNFKLGMNAWTFKFPMCYQVSQFLDSTGALPCL